MSTEAHIINPIVPVGEQALALCGFEWKTSVLGDAINADQPICRACVDEAVIVMTDAVTQLTVLTEKMARFADSLTVNVERFDGSETAQVLVRGDEFTARQRDLAEEKAAKKQAKAEKKKAIKKGVKKALAKQQKNTPPDYTLED